MARGGTRNGSTRIIRAESQAAYLRRMKARQDRALVTGRLNTFPRMEYQVHSPLLPLFGCQDLSEFF